MNGSSIRVIWPRPRLGDWATAGLAAGSLLGVIEAGAGLLWDEPGPPRLVLARIAATTLLVALPTFLLGLVLRRQRLEHETLVGAVVGPLLCAPVLGAAIRTLAEGRFTLLTGAALAAGVCAAAGLACALARAALSRNRQPGAPVPALVVWGTVALWVAFAEQFTGRAGIREWAGIAFLGAGLAVTLPGVYAVLDLAGSGWRSPPQRRILLGSLLAAALVSTAPALWPWLAHDARVVAELPESPNLLVIELPAGPVGGGARRRLTSVALLETDGVALEASGKTTASVLELPDGAPLLGELGARGHVTAAIQADPEANPPAGVLDVRVLFGTGARLRRDAARTAAGGLLASLGDGALSRLGLASEVSSPSEVTAKATSWLLGRTAARPLVPFALYVGYAFDADAAAADQEDLDEELTRLLTLTHELGLANSTFVVVLEPRRSSEPEAGDSFRVLVRPPRTGSGGPEALIELVDAAQLPELLWRECAEVHLEARLGAAG